MKKDQLIQALRKENFSDQVVKAFKKIPRENFVPKQLRFYAYNNEPIPLEWGATVSQPYTIAFMLDKLELKKNQKVLEIGSGSGYALALLSYITKGEIHGIEINEHLAKKSRINLKPYKNASIAIGNGSTGLEKEAPFDRILVSAAFKEIPINLCSQLKDEGIIVVPVENSIYKIKLKNHKTHVEEFPGFSFVPIR